MADSPKASEATSSDGESIEYLATARARRSTAGKHMSSLLDAEADDELALLFAEDEEDEEFTFGEDNVAEGGEGAATEDAEDMELDSSSDEEDQGPAAQEDELEGEKELEKQAKAERLKKRKAQDPMRLTTLRKKVKIDSNLPSRSMTIPAPRPRKKSERISWLPAVEDGPTRASSRKQTVQNKQLTHERLKDSEKRRLRLIATMEEAAKRKESTKAKQLTQEDRLAEAAKTERINSKSLNRWEEMEKKRSEEQRLRLEALQNRRLDGPVVTWWSGVARWINDKLTQVGIRSYTQAAEKEAGRRKKSKDVPPSSDQGLKAGESKTLEPPGDNNLTVKEAPPDTAALTTVDQQQPTEHSIKEQRKAVLDEGASFLDEIQLYASMPEEASSGPMEQSADAQTVKTSSVEITTVQSTSKKPTDPQPSDESASLSQAQISSQTPSQPHPTHIQPNTDISNPSAVQNPAPAPSSTYTQSPLVWAPITSSHPPADNLNSQPTHTAPDQPALGPPAPPKVETSSRNCVILQDFESTTLQERSDYSILFNPRKPQKLQKPTQEFCPITGRPARYRDPQTGVSYADAQAYREIRHVLAGRYAWSGFLGCFVGELGGGARGVPERFLAPNAAPPTEILAPPSASTSASTPAPTPAAAPIAVKAEESGLGDLAGMRGGSTSGSPFVDSPAPTSSAGPVGNAADVPAGQGSVQTSS